jgi:L-threonylcarbamoyladenylate synthase
MNATKPTRVLTVGPDATPVAAIASAAALLRAGRLVAFPTETVYGLGADATNAAAVAGIFAAKERPRSDPLIVHLPEAAQLPLVARAIPPAAWALAERFWPGPLTLVLPRAALVPALVSAGAETVAVRVPSHPVARALLRAAEVPVAAPSANRFMHTSPTSAAHVLADLDGRIDCVLDGGPCAVGLESTVVDLLTQPPRILRPGGVTLEELRTMLPDIQGPAQTAQPLVTSGTTSGVGSVAEPLTRETTISAFRSPGQLERHYAPHTRLVVFDARGAAALAAIVAEARAALAHGERVGVLVADEEAPALAELPVRVESLGPSDDLGAVARRLYTALRALDNGAVDLILAHTFGTQGLGLALWDRLRRAAGGQFRAVP